MKDLDLLKELTLLRREIHAHPELGNREFKTARVIERVLKDLKIPHKRLTPTGIVATLRGVDGPCVALRADMDALPLTEKTGKPYASKTPGVMHACGHDAHVAMLLGAARLLKERPPRGTVKFLFQPNEEGAGGARELIRKGAMKNPQVQAIFGLHVNPRFPSGTVAIKAGPLMAAVDRFEIEVFGQGGHAAYPHEGKDALAMAAELVAALQTIVSRKIDPLDPAVITVGTLNAGTRYNILAGSALLTGTVRTLSKKTQVLIPKLIRRITEGVTRAHGGKFRLEYETVGSVLSNDSTLADLARRTAVDLLGKAKVLEPDLPSMGGEDFSEYLEHAPGCFIYIGTGSKRMKALIPWHHPQFDLDESALPAGSRILAAVAEEFTARH